jgi:hypothetical protein
MWKKIRFVTLLSLLFVGGVINAHAQMGRIEPQHNEGPRTVTSNPTGSQPNLDDLMNSHAPAVVMNATPAKLTDFSTVSSKPSAAQKFSLDGAIANAVLSAPQGFELSLREADGYAPSLKIEQFPATIWVRLTGSKPDAALIVLPATSL